MRVLRHLFLISLVKLSACTATQKVDLRKSNAATPSRNSTEFTSNAAVEVQVNSALSLTNTSATRMSVRGGEASIRALYADGTELDSPKVTLPGRLRPFKPSEGMRQFVRINEIHVEIDGTSHTLTNTETSQVAWAEGMRLAFSNGMVTVALFVMEQPDEEFIDGRIYRASFLVAAIEVQDIPTVRISGGSSQIGASFLPTLGIAAGYVLEDCQAEAMPLATAQAEGMVGQDMFVAGPDSLADFELVVTCRVQQDGKHYVVSDANMLNLDQPTTLFDLLDLSNQTQTAGSEVVVRFPLADLKGKVLHILYGNASSGSLSVLRIEVSFDNSFDPMAGITEEELLVLLQILQSL